MKLADWLKQKNMTPPEFAKAIGVDRSNVTRWLKGELRPGWEDVLPKIIAATDGQVTANDFLPEGVLCAEVKATPPAAA